MNNYLRDEADDEVAALTRGSSLGWGTAIYNGRNSHQNGNGSHSAPMYTINGMGHTNNNAFGQSNWTSPPIHEGVEEFSSIQMPPTPGNFGMHMTNNGMLGNPLTNPAGMPINPLTNPNAMNTNITLINPLGGGTSIHTSQNTAHLDPNPERLLARDAGMNSNHVPYSNYESIMSSLGHFQNGNAMSYGQVSRMSAAGYVDREREMYREFGKESRAFELDERRFDLEEKNDSLDLFDGGELKEVEEGGLGVNEFGEGFEKRQEEFHEKETVIVDQEVIDLDAFQEEASVQMLFPPMQQSQSTNLATATTRGAAGAGATSRRTIALKEWMDLHKPRDCLPSSPKHKVYIEKVTILSHAIVTKIMEGFARKHNRINRTTNTIDGNAAEGEFQYDLNGDWEPRSSDIAVEYIIVTEVVSDNNDTTGGMKIEEITFDVITDFDWDGASWDENMMGEHQDAGLLLAMGKLMYGLYMQGEEFPVGAIVEKRQDGVAKRSGGGGDSKEDCSNDLLEVLRILADGKETGNATESQEENDLLFNKLRGVAMPLPLCRLICDIFQQSRSGTMTMVDLLSDLEQMIESPKAFLHGTITSRWELVFGNNQMFGRKKEMDQLMDAASRVEADDLKKEALLVTGHPGSGKSRLVQDIRKPLKARGWTFLRCKFEKLIQSEPLSVVALGLDEFFMSTMPCFPNTDSFSSPIDNNTGVECSCSKQSCPRKVVQELNSLLGLDGIKTLCRWMPGLKRLVKESYPMHAGYLDDVVDQQQSEQAIQELIHLLGSLLDVVASVCPVLFFVDDLQWADLSTMALLTSVISMAGSSEYAASSNCSLLFVGACRVDEGLTKEVVLRNLQQELEQCECICLEGFDAESLNKMMSEVLCLPCRKTLSLSKTIHEKTLGVPLFVVEMVDTLLAEELLTENDEGGWEWDTNAIRRKPIAEGVAELLSRKLEYLPSQVLRGLQIISCFESRLDFDGVDLEVIEEVQKYDAVDSADLSAALDMATADSLLAISGTTVAFSHDLIQNTTYELIPTSDRIPLLLKLITSLVTRCSTDPSGANVFVLATVNLMNRIGSDYMSANPQQSHLFAKYNLEAGRILIDQTKFAAALLYLQSGMSYIQGNQWEGNHYIASGLHSNLAVANYALGNAEECFNHANQVFEHATTFEDKFLAYCVYIKLLGDGSNDRAIEKLLYLLPFAGEPVDPNAISQQMAVDELMALKQALSGNHDKMLQLSPMTDNTMLLAMKLLGLLVLYSSQQKAFLAGYLAARMIRISLQYGQCEDTVYAMTIFCSSLVYTANDVDESYSLAQVTLLMMKNYNVDKLIPRVYGLIYGTVLSIKDTLQSTIEPLSRACHLTFSNAIHEHAVLNTLIYFRKCLYSGKKLPVLLDELASFTQKHQKLNQMPIIVHFLAPSYSTLSILSGIVIEEPKILSDYSKEPAEDIIVAAISQNELVFVRAAVGIVLFESIILRDFAKASEVVLNYSHFFEITASLELNLFFMAGLVSLHMARLTRESHWIEKGTILLSAYENWSLSNPFNYEHKYLLLKAEYHQLQNETEAAVEAYQSSINSARINKFLQHEAIACEMAAYHFGNIGDKQRTREMIQKTHDVYMEWGANAKAKSVLELLNLRYLDDTVLNTN